jgi:hypothetical protein
LCGVKGGGGFRALIAEFVAATSFDPVGAQYKEELRRDAVSTFAKDSTERMYDFLPPTLIG